MIAFVVSSNHFRELSPADWKRIGLILERALKWKGRRAIGVVAVTRTRIQTSNRTYRGIDRPTDVLSFEPGTDADAFAREDGTYMGDILICPAYVRVEARKRSVDYREELVRLIVHGVLHLAGFDHCLASEEKEMFSIQERCVRRFYLNT